MKMYGCWLESDILICKPEWEQSVLASPNTYPLPRLEAISYLEAGVPIYGARTISICPITGERRGFPFVLSDGFNCWTEAYTFHVSNGMLQLDEMFLNYMEDIEFAPKSASELDMKEIYSFLGI